eukprot:7726752-Pyramimonas_sp.AAC.1
MEVWGAELREEKELLAAAPLEELFTVPTQMVPDQSVLITVADEQRGHLPKWGRIHDPDTEETYVAPLCTLVEDDSDGLDSDENGPYVELCFTTEMSKVVLSEQQLMLLDVDRVATMRVYVATVAKRAAVVKEDD